MCGKKENDSDYIDKSINTEDDSSDFREGVYDNIYQPTTDELDHDNPPSEDSDSD